MPFPVRSAGSRALRDTANLRGVRRNRPRSQKELVEGSKVKQDRRRLLCARSGRKGQQTPRQVERSRRCCGLSPVCQQ